MYDGHSQSNGFNVKKSLTRNTFRTVGFNLMSEKFTLKMNKAEDFFALFVSFVEYLSKYKLIGTSKNTPDGKLSP